MPERTSGKKGKTVTDRKLSLLCMCIILCIAWFTYQPALKNDFTNWDDDKYVYENPLLNLPKDEAVSRMFAEPYYLLYTPLTLLSYGLNYWYQGTQPHPFILTNIILHILNSLLVFLIMRKISDSELAGLFAGLMFALHPMHVESVAWISERKDVLYTLFFFAAMLSWLEFQIQRTKIWYLASLLLFLLSCLSKPSAVIFPVILILLDVRFEMLQKLKSVHLKPAQNFNYFQLLNPVAHLNKIPFFLLSIIFGWILLFGVETQGGTTHSEELSSHTFSTMDNILIAIYSYVWYPVKMIWPWPLSAFYAYPLNTEPLPWYIQFSPLVLLLIGISFGYAWKKRQTEILFTWLFYTVSIFLFIKVLTTVGAITYDRYFYVASLSFCLLAGFALKAAWNHSVWKYPALIAGIVLCIIWAGISHTRVQIWKNSYTLMSDMISLYPRHLPFAYNNRGLWLSHEKRFPEAVEDFRKSIQIDPNSPNAWLNAGKTFGELGLPDSAVIYLENSLKRNPNDSKVYNNLGNAYGLLGRFEEARNSFHQSLKIDPDNANALFNLAVTYGLQGDTLTADSIMRISARLGNEGAHNSLKSRGKL